ncbi:MAG: AraC family transcriptional regulator [Acidobacteriota bacterium]
MKLCRGHFCGEIIRHREVAGFTLTETRYAPDAEVPRHSHENGYACFVRQGGYTENYGAKTRDCQPLTVAFHPADEIHSEHFHNSEVRSFNIEFSPAALDRIRRCSTVLDAQTEFHGGAIAALAMKLYREFLNDDEASEIAIEGALLEMIAEASRRRMPERKAPRWLEEAREILHARFSESITIAALASAVGVHPVYLSSVFRRNYHCTTGEYLRRLRIEYACREIVSSARPLVDIALAAGFSHQSHFTRIFKQQTGLTPDRYRKALQSN